MQKDHAGWCPTGFNAWSSFIFLFNLSGKILTCFLYHCCANDTQLIVSFLLQTLIYMHSSGRHLSTDSIAGKSNFQQDFQMRCILVLRTCELFLDSSGCQSIQSQCRSRQLAYNVVLVISFSLFFSTANMFCYTDFKLLP